MVLLAIALLAGMGQVLVIFEEVMFYENLDKEDPLYYQYNRSRILLQEHFGTVKNIQSLLFGIVCLSPTAPGTIVLLPAGLAGLAITTVVLATLGAFVSELSEGTCFTEPLYPWALAGNFFAGNQRN